jgi:2-polyprenyl-3-methyl-5-hydroxy-6-metoxy-1,4-benzoquinol methylase
MKSTLKDDQVEQFYQNHHVSGGRLRQSFMEKRRTEVFQKWIGSNRRILDAGCRDGTLTRNFLEGNQVVGGDIDSEALRYAEKSYGFPTQKINLNERLPFEEGAFDVIIVAEVLEHLPYPKVTLAEFFRILAPGGRLIGNVPLAYHLMDRWKVIRGKKLIVGNDPTHLQYFTYGEFLQLLGEQFVVQDCVVLKGGKLGERYPHLFARNLSFCCYKDHGKK